MLTTSALHNSKNVSISWVKKKENVTVTKDGDRACLPGRTYDIAASDLAVSGVRPRRQSDTPGQDRDLGNVSVVQTAASRPFPARQPMTTTRRARQTYYATETAAAPRLCSLVRLLGACLVHPEIKKLFKILRHIKSGSTCMKH